MYIVKEEMRECIRDYTLVNNVIQVVGFTQVVDESTRAGNTLDIFLLRPLESIITSNFFARIKRPRGSGISAGLGYEKIIANRRKFEILH